MSTVTIRAEVVERPDPFPLRAPVLIIDGVLLDTSPFHLTADMNLLRGDFMLEVDGVAIMSTSDFPERRYLDGDDAGLVEWIWREVEVTR